VHVSAEPLCLFGPAARGGGAVTTSTKAGMMGNQARNVEFHAEPPGNGMCDPVAIIVGRYVIKLAPRRLFVAFKHLSITFCFPRPAR